MPAEDFERRIGDLLSERFPFCVLSGVCAFRPDTREDHLFSNQIDHLLHIREPEGDRMILVECKHLMLWGTNSCSRPTGSSGWNGPNGNTKQQVCNQSSALYHLLKVWEERQRVRFEGWVIHRGICLPEIYDYQKDNHKIQLRLMDEPGLLRHLQRRTPFSAIPVQRSRLLRPLLNHRAGPGLFHPPIPDAIDALRRTREELDREIYDKLRFPASGSNWCIQGSAGTGKSVLAAYAVAALSTGRVIVRTSEGTPSLDSIDSALPKNFPDRGQLRIQVSALTEFQVDVLEQRWKDFVRLIAKMSRDEIPAIRPVYFEQWRGRIREDCNILVIDESHDLANEDQLEVAGWLNADPAGRYLIVAQDRHQQIREHGLRVKIFQGLNFSWKCSSLSRSYRSPFSVTAAATSLLFRWHSERGPMVRPKTVELRTRSGQTLETFVSIGGIKLENRPARETGQVVAMRNDSHPGNGWRRTIDLFEDALDLHGFLQSNRVAKTDVLWLRFSQQHPDLQDLTLQEQYRFHRIDPANPADFIDRNIKGLEFPVVVIEGTPQPIDPGETEEENAAMWRARRQLYLCATRASAFVYFVLVDNPHNRGIRQELLEILNQLREPTAKPFDTGLTWKMRILWRECNVVELRDYLEAMDRGEPDPEDEGEVQEGAK